MPNPAGPGSSGAPPARLMGAALAGAAVLVIAGAAAFYYASRQAGERGANDAIVVTIENNACDPNVITVPAGANTFKVVNKTERPVEWEILDGVMVVEERENIVPGLSRTLTARLSPGTFEITCGLLGNPRGTLHVTPSTASAAEAARPKMTAFIGPLAEYQVFLATEAGHLTEAVNALDAAIRAGDLATARALYEPARLPYMRMEAAANHFADLDNVIDPVADYLAGREQDPGFVGFHRIEYSLFAKDSTDGLAGVSSRLLADVGKLETRLRSLDFPPDQIAKGAARLVTAIADTKMQAGENHYAHTDLADFDANIEGVARMMNLLKPIASKAAPKVMGEIDRRLAEVSATLADLKQDNGFPPYPSVDAATREKLSQQMHALADAIGKLNEAVGLA